MNEQELTSGEEREKAERQQEEACAGLRMDYQMSLDTATEAGVKNYPDYEAWLERRVLSYQSIHANEFVRIKALEAENAANMNRAKQDAYINGLAVGDFIREKTERIQELEAALRGVIDDCTLKGVYVGPFYEDAVKKVKARANEALHANG